MDLDLRKLRYFVAVAEELHFGRAAERLLIAQPVLSRQVMALEREIGVGLLDRTSRHVALTPAGERLADEGRSLLASATTAVRRTHEAARGLERLVIGFAPGLRVAPAVAAIGEVAPELDVALIELVWYEGADAVRDGRADIAVVREPFDDDGLMSVPLGAEPKLAVLSAHHRLAGKRRLRMRDLEGEGPFEADRRCAGIEGTVELAASGRGVAILPRSVATLYARPGLVLRPIVDREPLGIHLVRMSGAHDRVRELFELAAETLDASQSA
ncbi:LysR family transcriptional regulator [Planctomonas sp. JC2975]|uniref:LysR family transcriptional regulator n=1 Tax=Planctomonas sp. JC2975 TaxID=2729626 RepID=UPI0014757F3F|nr:LysR substrate-binding domain-containing protein [Planctomonas sp. JC2975]NNC14106.1 LysR family transcriptional regulator [Planctomonas sp. JC2975]